MRTPLALLLLALGALHQTAFADPDTTPPTCKILDSTIGKVPGRQGYTRFTYYVKVADETALQPYTGPKGPIEYRARVNNVSNDLDGFRPWAPWIDDPSQPIFIDVKCTSFQFEVRGVDAAGNRSPAVVRRYRAPFPLTQAPLSPTFSRAKNFPTGGNTVGRVLARFDFDGDGNPDIAQADDDSGVLKIRRNTEGDGKTFTDLDLQLTATSLDAIAGGMLAHRAGGTTNDEFPDLAVATNGTITVELNQGVTTGVLGFSPQNPVLSVQDHGIQYVAVGDLDDDGFDDIVSTATPFTSGQSKKIAVFLNQSGTTSGFAAPVLIDSSLGFFYDLQVADLNDDGFPDVAVSGFTFVSGNGIGAYEIFLNDGAGNLTRGETQLLNDYPTAVALGDVTGDGVPDLVMTIAGNYAAPGSSTKVRAIVQVLVLQNKGDGTFDFLHQFPLADTVVDGPPRTIRTGVAVGNATEIVAASDLSNIGKIYTLKTILDPDDGSLFASLLVRSSSFISGGPIRAFAFSDLDGNGKRDIFTANTSATNQASVLLNITPGGLTVPNNFKFNVTGDPKPRNGFISGWDFNFSTVLAASAAGLKLRVQSTLTPDDEGSWTDLPGGGYMTKSGVNNWRLLATDIPTGSRTFRVIASADDFPDQITKHLGPFTITAPVYNLDLRLAAVLDTTPKVQTGTFKTSHTLKVERGNTGILAVQVTNTGSRDKFVLQIPRSAMGEHFRTLVATDVAFEPPVTPGAPGDTFVSLETPPINHNGTYTFYLKGRVSATTPAGEIGSFTVSGKANANANITDTAQAKFEASNPKNTFFVTNTNDTGAGSLRQAIFDLSAQILRPKVPAPDVKFEIPTTDPNYNSGVPTITLQSSLLPIPLHNVVIDGHTQTDYTRFSGLPDATILIRGDSFDAKINNRTPKVNVGLDILTSGCRIERLIFADMETGIRLSGRSAKQNVIRGCGFLANHDAGVLIESGASKNAVGGSEASYRNFFMAQQALITFGSFGVWIRGNDTDGNTVQGNLIGEGLRNLGGNTGMGDAGVCIMDGAQGNLVGGTSLELRNVIVLNGLAANFAHDQFGGVSISGLHTDGNLVQGNYIGVDEAGTAGAGNELGVEIKDGAKNNLIGGTDPGAGNVISDSSGNGISISGIGSAPTTGNRVVGNIIGLNAAGDAAIPNGDNGIDINSASDNIIGGTTTASRNIISGNVRDGVHLVAHGTLVQGNYIGTDITGQFARPNGGAGVFILGGDDNVIGFNGKSTGANIIAYNTDRGVEIDTAKIGGSQTLTGYRNTIRGNSILGNGKLGIDLHGGIETGDGVTLNGTGTATDSNEGVNHPEIQTAAVVTGSGGAKTTNVVVKFNSVVNTNFAFDFYASDVADPSGFGEGAQSLGYLERKTDANGNLTFSGTIKGDYGGKVITATATRKNGADFGSTSEFSGAVSVTQ